MIETAAKRFDWDIAKQRLNSLRASLEECENISEEQSAKILDARAMQLAKIPIAPPDTSEVVEVVQFQLGGESYAVETQYVFELVKARMVTPIPGTKPYFLGVTNLRGVVTTIIDLAQYLGVSGSDETLGQIIVLGRAEPELGIAVADVGDVKVLHRDQLMEPASVVGAHRELMAGCAGDGLLVFEGERLLRCESLYVEQSD